MPLAQKKPEVFPEVILTGTDQYGTKWKMSIHQEPGEAFLQYDVEIECGNGGHHEVGSHEGVSASAAGPDESLDEELLSLHEGRWL
jgi:hypothetical protein